MGLVHGACGWWGRSAAQFPAGHLFFGASPQWSTDGTEITLAVRDQDGHFVEIVTVQAQETRRIPLPIGIPDTAMLRWSPDGRFFVYSDQNAGFEVNQLWLVPASEGEPIPVTDSRRNDLSPSWSPDSRRLFFVSMVGARWISGSSSYPILRDLRQQLLA